jgi:small subunit ribosomal protein S21
VQVFVRDNDVNGALRVLKKKMQREGTFREMKRRRSYEKPSERRVRERAEGIRRYRKAMRKRLEREGYWSRRSAESCGKPRVDKTRARSQLKIVRRLLMRKPNYRFERAERDRAKKARNDKKLQRQQQRAVPRAEDGAPEPTAENRPRETWSTPACIAFRRRCPD